MKSTVLNIQSLMEGDPIKKHTQLSDRPCPKCGRMMRSFTRRDESKNELTQYRCIYLGTVTLHGGSEAERWVGCDYTVLEQQTQKAVTKIHENSIKSKVMNTFLYGSLIGNRKMLEKTLSDFEVLNDETSKAKQAALEIVSEVLANQEPHFILTGPAGTGKTHLALATGREVIEKSNYEKGALFLSYSELYAKYKESITIPELVKAVLSPVFKEIENIDLLVVDDIGAELGRIEVTTTATNYNIELLQRIAEYRTDKATIFTTNLTSKQLVAIYGDRIYSRILSNVKRENGSYRAVTFTNTDDGRKRTFY